MNIAFPFQFDPRGRTLLASSDDHIRQMIEQLLFTNPGERVNRAEFGSGVEQLIFAPNSPELAAAIQFNLQGSLQRYLGDLIEVQKLDVQSDDATVSILVSYVVRQTGQPQTARFELPAS